MPNKLAESTSPYLQQHRDNPINWFPWDEEAFEAAHLQNKPIFLSIGYSSCHWCRVMAHESFEDPEVAEVVNSYFISIKVDREERPDIDDTYMTALQLTSGRGGWPMTLFLTPDKKPFFAGTYFPKNDYNGHPGFLSILKSIAALWYKDEQLIREEAEHLSKLLSEALMYKNLSWTNKLDIPFIESAINSILEDYDPVHGGFGSKPKFPPHTTLSLMLKYLQLPSSTQSLKAKIENAIKHTLTQIALGGIHDHIGGGFHRYSTDEKWLLPHFEKMLYDNAQLLTNYLDAKNKISMNSQEYALLNNTSKKIIHWLTKEMTAPDGTFYSALDADSEGQEGRYYVWTLNQIKEALCSNSEDFIKTFSIEKQGNFREEATGEYTGQNVLHLKKISSKDYSEQLSTLYKIREKRPKPGLDYKALASWNGLMIKALVHAKEYDLATRCADTWLKAWHQLGYLPHQIVHSEPSGHGFLDDYAYLIEALYQLGQHQSCYQEPAEQCTEEMTRLFYNEKEGGFFYTADRHENIFGRTHSILDQATPSANAIAIQCLIHKKDFTRAYQSLVATQGWMEKAPHATASHLETCLEFLQTQQETNSSDSVRTSITPLKPTSKKGWLEAKIMIHLPYGSYLNPLEKEPFQIDAQNFPQDQVTYSPEPTHTGSSDIQIPVYISDQVEQSPIKLQIRLQICTDTECLPEQQFELETYQQ